MRHINRLRLLAFLALLSVFMAVPSCTITKPRPDGTTPLSNFATCTTDAIKDKALGLQDDVASAVATGDWQEQLKALTMRVGWDVGLCAVDLFIDSMTGRKAEADEMARQQLQRAQEWRREQMQSMPVAPPRAAQPQPTS